MGRSEGVKEVFQRGREPAEIQVLGVLEKRIDDGLVGGEDIFATIVEVKKGNRFAVLQDRKQGDLSGEDTVEASDNQLIHGGIGQQAPMGLVMMESLIPKRRDIGGKDKFGDVFWHFAFTESGQAHDESIFGNKTTSSGAMFGELFEQGVDGESLGAVFFIGEVGAVQERLDIGVGGLKIFFGVGEGGVLGIVGFEERGDLRERNRRSVSGFWKRG